MSAAFRRRVRDVLAKAPDDRAGMVPQGRILVLSGGEGERERKHLLESTTSIEKHPISRLKTVRLITEVLCCLALGLLLGSRFSSGLVEEGTIDNLEEGLDLQTLARQLRLPAANYGGAVVREVSAANRPLSIKRISQAARQTQGAKTISEVQPALRKVYGERSKKSIAPSMPVIAVVEQIIKKHGKKSVSSKKLAHNIVEVSKSMGYDPIFVAAVIKSESAFNTHARSHKGARGLMQLMPATGAWLVRTMGIPKGTLTDPKHNLRLGISYLKQLEAQYGGNRLFALVAYNWGPGHVKSATGGKRRVPRECMKYALTILRDHNNWKKGFI